jgi:hypothetical protein
VPLTAFFVEVSYLLPSHAVGLETRWPGSFARIYEFATDRLVSLHSDYDSLVWPSRRDAGCG